MTSAESAANLPRFPDSGASLIRASGTPFLLEYAAMQAAGAQRGPTFEEPDDYKRAFDVLQSLSYTEIGVTAALGIDKKAVPRTRDPIFVRRTAGGSPLETLLRLFLLDIAVDVDAARQALQPMDLEVWVKAGLVSVQNGSARGELRFSPYRNLVLAHDFWRYPNQNRPDFVMGVGGATRTMAGTTIRKHSNLTLDLGTGSGVLAFLACEHSDSVYAVDRNARSIEVARFNSRLNNIANVECREGNLFEPVEGMKFDLVVSDPPFVISPPSGFLYLHGGMRGDQFCRTIAREVPQYLKEGGYFQMLFNWPLYAGRDSDQELEGWFEGTGCDTWVMRVSTEAAPEYASTWTQHIHESDRERSNRLFHEWMDYYEAEGIVSMCMGLVTMRRCSTRGNWFSLEDAPPNVKENCGPDIEAKFESCHYSASHDDAALLDAKLRCSPNARLDYSCEPDGIEWRMAGSVLRLESALPFSSRTDPFTAGLLVRCDGQTPLRNLLPDLADAIGTDVAGVAAASLKAVRHLLERGFLLP